MDIERLARPCTNPECDHLTIHSNTFRRNATPAEQAELRAAGVKERRRGGLCNPCHRRAQRGGGAKPRVEVPREVVVAEYRFLADYFPSRAAPEARASLARRLGMSVDALDAALARARRDGELAA